MPATLAVLVMMPMVVISAIKGATVPVGIELMTIPVAVTVAAIVGRSEHDGRGGRLAIRPRCGGRGVEEIIQIVDGATSEEKSQRDCGKTDGEAQDQKHRWKRGR